jgi:MFS family permease
LCCARKKHPDHWEVDLNMTEVQESDRGLSPESFQPRPRDREAEAEHTSFIQTPPMNFDEDMRTDPSLEMEQIQNASVNSDVRYLFVNNILLGVILSFPETFEAFMLVGAFQPAVMQYVECGLSAPWMMKVTFGWLIDKNYVPTTVYIHVMMAGAAMCWLLVSFVSDTYSIIALMVCVSFCVSFADVALDTIMVQRSNLEPEGVGILVQSQSLLWRSVGMAIGGFAGGWTYNHGGKQEVVSVLVVIAMLFVSTSFLMLNVQTKPPQTDVENFGVVPTPRSSFKSALTLDYKKAVAFTILVHSVPSCSSLFDYFQIYQLKFSPTMIGTLDMIGYVALICGASLYNSVCEKFSSQMILRVSLAVYAIETIFFPSVLITRQNVGWGLSDGIWSIGDGAFRAVGSKMLIMPIYGAILPMCKGGHEAKLYALFTNLSNLATLLSTGLGANLAQILHITKEHMDNLWIIFVIRGAIFGLLAIVAGYFIHNERGNS